MNLIKNIEVELSGTLTRGISEVWLDEGELKIKLTDGCVRSLGSLLPESSDEIIKDSCLIPSMKAVAEYCERMLVLDGDTAL